MARYLFKMGVTPQTFAKLIKNPDDRAKGARPAFEALGGKLIEYYFAVGQGGIYTLAELPDEVSAEALMMSVLAGGAVTSFESTVLLTAAEAMEAMKKAGATGYKPPA